MYLGFRVLGFRVRLYTLNSRAKVQEKVLPARIALATHSAVWSAGLCHFVHSLGIQIDSYVSSHY